MKGRGANRELMTVVGLASQRLLPVHTKVFLPNALVHSLGTGDYFISQKCRLFTSQTCN